MNTVFDGFIGIDWSGAAQPGYAGIAVARCGIGTSAPTLVKPPAAKHWTRQAVLDWLLLQLRGRSRLLVGFDFAFALPGETQPIPALWAAIEAHCAADADLLGSGYVDADPRFWRSGKQPVDWLAQPRRATEGACAAAGLGQPQSPLQLIGAKQVGKGALAGMRLLHRLRSGHQDHIAIWPFDKPGEDDRRSVCVEIYPRLFIRKAGLGNAKLRTLDDLDTSLEALGSARYATRKMPDDHQADALVSAAGLRFLAGSQSVWAAGRGERDGWIFGVPREPIKPTTT